MADGRTILGDGNIGGRFVELQVWIGDPGDPTKGISIENESIESIDISENLFSMLPTINMVVNDHGRMFFRYNFRIGNTLNVRIKPSSTMKDDADEVPSPYVDTAFTIQAITDIPDNRNGIYIHRVSGVYAAVTYLNNIVQYPKELSFFEVWPTQKTSAEVISSVLAETGLSFVADVTPNDYSFWLNANETAANFCERIIQHAWIDYGDAPILFTDVNGIAHLSSIKTICANKSQIQFADMQSSVDVETSEKTPSIMISDAFCLNAGGPVSNAGAYKVKTSFYTPKNIWSLQSTLEFPQEGQGLLGSVVGLVSKILGGGINDRTEAYRIKECHRNDTFLAGITNKQTSEMNNVTISSDGGMHFDELHTHYEIAPAHNEMIRRSFFQNFIRIAIDTSRQGNLYEKPAYRPTIGSVVKCDFSSSTRIDTIHSGEYAVAEIVHKYSKGEPYTQNITLVNDGYFDVGE